MAVDIKVPAVGESISEGNIARWLKKNGDFVKLDETIFELETEKATQEVPAPVSGILQIRVGEGQTVVIGAVVGSIEPAAAPLVSNPAPTPVVVVPETKEPSGPHVSPAAAALIAEHKLDPVQIAGTGKHGVILKEDVDTFLARARPAAPTPIAQPAAPKPAAGTRETREKMSAIRLRIAERLLASQKTTASLTTFNEVDMQAIMDLRAKYKDRFKERHQVGLGFMSFFVKAVVEALKAFPLVNASIDGPEIVHHHYYNIGVAVSTEKGLMVPVLADADQLSFADVEKNITSLAVRARDGKIKVDELQGGTFTITNGGIFGSMMSTPILNPPQAAILGMHAINKRPVVKDDQIVIRPMMYLALTYDHRLIDGREAVQFLVRVKECIENPERMLLEV